MLNIGAQKEAVAEAKETILAILQSGQEQETIRAALEALGEVCRVSNVNVSSNQFYGDSEG